MASVKINKILIANRGEIACRIIATAQRMGIECVAVYSDVDQYAQHVQLADEAWHIGASPATESYLDAKKILQIAKKSHANAVHPGYGFLSENASFAAACKLNDIIFIGPPQAAIEAMGSKSEAKRIMATAKVPLVEGYHGADQSEVLLESKANQIGFPVLIKATAGGGGKGMRLVERVSEFNELLRSCKREALSSFADDRVLIEKYLVQPRHIEIQIFVDNDDNAVYLFERDCSLQRRHQKIIEEAPAPNFSQEKREQMGGIAITAAKAIGYRGAGTVEFLYDKTANFYFMEMNTRLQVEHPVTEMITGVDLVEWQILIANGMKLPCQQSELQINGHAFEARIYAEDPNNHFLPTTGEISHFNLPALSQNVRIDSGITCGDSISVFYDPMIAKLIVWDKDRASALARLRASLADFQVAGLTTNIEFLHQVASNDAFNNADIDTHFLEQHSDELCDISSPVSAEIVAAAAFEVMLKQSTFHPFSKVDPYSPWNETLGWRLNEDNHHLMTFLSANHLFSVTAHFRNTGYNNISNRFETIKNKSFLFEIDEQEYWVSGYLKTNKIYLNINGHQSSIGYARNGNQLVLFKNASSWSFEIKDTSLATLEVEEPANLVAPMPGTITQVLVSDGDHVEQGQALVLMEAMKMEHTIKAHKNMQVKEVLYAIGDLVDEGVELIRFEED